MYGIMHCFYHCLIAHIIKYMIKMWFLFEAKIFFNIVKKLLISMYNDVYHGMKL